MVGHLKSILACCYVFLTSDYDNKRFTETLREHCGFVVEFEWIGNSIGKCHSIVLEGEYVQGWYVKTLLCVWGGGGLKGHCTWLLLPLILFSCRPSPLLLFPTEGGDLSGSSLIPLSPLPLSPFSCLCCSIFPCIFASAPFVTLPLQEVTSVVEGCLCALIHTGDGDSGDVRINNSRGHQGVQVQPFWAKFSS